MACTQSSVIARPTRGQSLLKRQILFTIRHSDLPHTIKAIEVSSRKDNRILFHSNSQILLNPASNLKIITTSFALDNLGKDFTFNTKFCSEGSFHDGEIMGNLVVLATGDPIITDSDMDSCARVIAERGVNLIDGNIIIDISKFDSLEWGTGWMWDDEPQGYAMFISPASIDHDVVDANIGLDPVSKRLEVTLHPSTSFVKVVSTATPGQIDSINATRILVNDTNTVVVSGTYTPNYSDTVYEFSVRHPAIYFGSLFQEALQRNGVRITGRVIETRIPVSPDSLTLLAEISHSIDTVVTYVNKVSDNLGAECLLRDVPNIVKGEIGSARNGLRLERSYLRACGVDSTEYVIVDGSGVSRYDVVTPADIVLVLNHTLNTPEGKIFFKSLPVSGVDGTLEYRMQDGFVAGKVHAKTGSLSGVSTLSGYVIIPGDTLVFSMMMQNYPPENDSSVIALQDQLCKILALYNDNARIFRRNLRVYEAGTYGIDTEKRF